RVGRLQHIQPLPAEVCSQLQAMASLHGRIIFEQLRYRRCECRIRASRRTELLISDNVKDRQRIGESSSRNIRDAGNRGGGLACAKLAAHKAAPRETETER